MNKHFQIILKTEDSINCAEPLKSSINSIKASH